MCVRVCILDPSPSPSPAPGQAIATERNVVVVPPELGLPLQSLAPLGCGVQTGAGAIMNTLKYVRPGSAQRTSFVRCLARTHLTAPRVAKRG